MKALTLTQPWASLIPLGYKRIETRSWSTSYRGELAIHAGSNLAPVGGKSGLLKLCSQEPFRECLSRGLDISQAHHPITWANLLLKELPFGAIVATAKLVDCVPTENCHRSIFVPSGYREERDKQIYVSTLEYGFGDYSEDRFAWLFEDIAPLSNPIPMRGYQQLWECHAL